MLVKNYLDVEYDVHKEYLSTGATTAAVVWTPATGKRIVLTDLTLQDGGGGVSSVFFGSDVAATRETDASFPNSNKKGHTGRVVKGNFAANGGIEMSRHIFRRGGLNEALKVTMPAAGAYLFVSGYEEEALLPSGA